MKSRPLVVILMVLTSPLFSQNEYLNSRIKSLKVDSEVLGEQRELLIYSPNFETGLNLRYPTLYLLDGRENMSLTLGIISNLVRANVIPEVNVIGVNNYDYDRTKDLTPPHSELKERFGGADKFLKFLKTEVMSIAHDQGINAQFNVLIGHSLGGLFTTYVLLNDPDEFDAYLQIGSSYWYDEEAIPKALLAADFEKLKSKKLYFSLANEKDSEQGFDLLRTELPKNAEGILFEKLEDTDHITGLTPAIFRGLQFAFREWKGWDLLYEGPDFQGVKEKVETMSNLYGMDVKPRAVELASFARSFTGQGQYEKAIEILSYLEGFHPRHIMVLNYLGEAYQKQGNKNQAIMLYERSLKVAEERGSPMKRWIKARLAELDK